MKCQRCGCEFSCERKNRMYCSPRCRFNAWYAKKHQAPGCPRPCVYCGAISDTIDHIPPQHVRAFLAEEFGDRRWPFLEVPACRECNCVLGGKALWTVGSRKRFMKEWIRKRYARYLKMPEWSDEEIAGLSHRGEILKTVVYGMAIKKMTRQRLLW